MLVFLPGWDDITKLHKSLGQLPQASWGGAGGWWWWG